MKKKEQYIWGTLFIIVGIILGLNLLNITNINIFFDGWWTLFIIIPCLIGLFTDKDKIGSAIGIAIGILLLLNANDIIDFSILSILALPIILIVIGLLVIFKDSLNKNKQRRKNERNS